MYISSYFNKHSDAYINSTPSTAADTTNVTSPNSKGKGKAPTTDHPMNEDAHEAEEEDDEEEEEEGEEEDDDDEEDEVCRRVSTIHTTPLFFFASSAN